MSTAAMPKTNSSPLVFNWDSETATSEYYIYMHFAEVVKLKANQYRSFNIILNGQYWYGPVVPKNMSTTTVFSTVAMRIAKQYEVSMIKTENSTLPPIINALEIFSIKNLLQSETDQQDGLFLHTYSLNLYYVGL
nr:putative lrr receptor-like serine/threonine-protein kinase [Quercus suber]